MKKFNMLFLPLIFFTTFIKANNYDEVSEKLYSFIGVQTSITSFDTISAPTIGLKYGKQTKDTRTSFSYNYGKNSNHTFQTLLMQIDTGIMSNTFRDIALKPYIGASIGAIQYDNGITKDKGFVYGLNTGFSYILNDALDLDLGYHFLKTSKVNTINNINDLTFSMNYFY